MHASRLKLRDCEVRRDERTVELQRDERTLADFKGRTAFAEQLQLRRHQLLQSEHLSSAQYDTFNCGFFISLIAHFTEFLSPFFKNHTNVLRRISYTCTNN